MGGVCAVGKDDSLKLYVVWAKNSEVSDFTYEKREITILARDGVKKEGEQYKTKTVSGWFITRYNGASKLVVIPETIDGVPVIGIDAKAFWGFTERVVIPKSVYEIEDKAFSGCTHLREVVFFDSLQQVQNGSFPSCVRTIVLNAQRSTNFTSGEGGVAIKYERVRMLANDKKLIVISGSSSLYGLVSEKLEEYLDYEYNVINYGTNAGVCMTFYMEAMMKYLGEGDIVVHAPEYTSSAQWGDNQIVWRHFRGNSQCYDIFREVDMRNFTDFWKAWCDYMTECEGSPVALRNTYQYQTGNNLNKYGDLVSNRPGPTYVAPKNPTGKISTPPLNATRISRLHKIYLELKSKGAMMVLSFGTTDRANINPKYLNRETYDKYNKSCADQLDYPVISDINTYIMDHELMNNSTAHCSNAGAEKRTRDLANDLKNYFNGIYQ
jgi:hypothetical protein